MLPQAWVQSYNRHLSYKLQPHGATHRSGSLAQWHSATCRSRSRAQQNRLSGNPRDPNTDAAAPLGDKHVATADFTPHTCLVLMSSILDYLCDSGLVNEPGRPSSISLSYASV
ncbi:hypothetical protein Vafri_20705 [Volvox africanus]|uniref:Uncharacterized protein n=1 Tax=Volvox africanus TaxID=51714 RepID=A0A8J4BRV1_9CHLO|nr:hypothetical protein Vafri_20705 [Volvox africanus]